MGCGVAAKEEQGEELGAPGRSRQPAALVAPTPLQPALFNTEIRVSCGQSLGSFSTSHPVLGPGGLEPHGDHGPGGLFPLPAGRSFQSSPCLGFLQVEEGNCQGQGTDITQFYVTSGCCHLENIKRQSLTSRPLKIPVPCRKGVLLLEKFTVIPENLSQGAGNPSVGREEFKGTAHEVWRDGLCSYRAVARREVGSPSRSSLEALERQNGFRSNSR